MKHSLIGIFTFNEWDELISYINSVFAVWPQYIFRGHSRSDWLLEPTLTRALKNIKYPNKDELTKQHLEKFALQIRGRRGLNPKNLSENELWALGQHFGLYTPLLDWTRSPYVGLFFALSNAEKSPTGYRTLWALNHSDIDSTNEWHKKKKRISSEWNLELINPLLDENNRLVNQNSLFTKVAIGNDIENWVLKGPTYGWYSLYRINFSENIRDTAIMYLDQMNINYSSLFPDLLGSSMETNIKLEQTDYLIKKQEDIWNEFENPTKT